MRTLYDNIETTISRHPQARGLQSACKLRLAFAVCIIKHSTWAEIWEDYCGCLAAQEPFLGERAVNSQGEPGAYEWMTYKQVGRCAA